MSWGAPCGCLPLVVHGAWQLPTRACVPRDALPQACRLGAQLCAGGACKLGQGVCEAACALCWTRQQVKLAGLAACQV